MLEGELAGILTRREATGRRGKPASGAGASDNVPARTNDSGIAKVADRFDDQTVVVTNRDGGIVGVITLHDLLRAQVEKAEG